MFEFDGAWRYCAILALLCLPGSVRSQEPKAKDEPEIATKTDIPYAKANGTELKLDLVLPKGQGPHPAVMVIHGGAWRAGNKKDCMFIMPDFARRGYAAISPQYR